jgi:hypothetical protein
MLDDADSAERILVEAVHIGEAVNEPTALDTHSCDPTATIPPASQPADFLFVNGSVEHRHRACGEPMV